MTITKEQAVLPPIDKHDHPDCHTMAWSELELRAIEQYRQAAYKLGRNAGLEEARKATIPHNDIIAASRDIESLKDKTS